jgi:hypothetical protein
MRLPFLQVAMEVIEQVAPDLAVMLDREESAIGWGLMKLFPWALGRCPENKPPSACAVVEGPSAARLIARAAGFSGDPEVFVDACEAVRPDPVLERTDGGIRVCGLGRYDAAWLKNLPKDDAASWRLFLAGTGANPPGTGANPALNRAEQPLNRAEPALHTHTHTQIEIHKEDVRTSENPIGAMGAIVVPAVAQGAEPDRRGHVPAVPSKPDKPDDSWDSDDFASWANVKRFEEEGLPPDRKFNTRDVSAWWSALRMAGFTTRDARKGFVEFGNDPYWLERKLPIKAFVSQWEKYVRKNEVRRAG